MVLNRCINCAYFITCQRTDKDENKRDCEYFKKSEVKEVKYIGHNNTK